MKVRLADTYMIISFPMLNGFISPQLGHGFTKPFPALLCQLFSFVSCGAFGTATGASKVAAYTAAVTVPVPAIVVARIFCGELFVCIRDAVDEGSFALENKRKRGRIELYAMLLGTG